MSKRKVGVWVAAGLLAGLTACAGTKEATKDVGNVIPGVEETATGVVVQNDDQQIAVKNVKDPQGEAVWFKRRTDTVLEENGKPVDWNQLTEGTPVRVHYEEATGPEQAYKVEVLTGEEGEKVKSQVPVEAPAWRKPTGYRSTAPKAPLISEPTDQ